MTKFKINPELLIGGSSKMDAVFLPVSLDSDFSGDAELGYHRIGPARGNGPGRAWQHQDYHGDFQHSRPLLRAGDLQITGGDGPHLDCKREDVDSDPSSALMHALTTDTPDPDDWCYRASLTSIVVIVVVVLFLVLGHSYIYSVLIWLEQVGPVVSVSVLMLLFVIICFPVAWGLQLLMLTAGYLFGLLYGPLVVTMSVTVGLLVSTPVMRYMCSGYLRSRFYSSKVEAIVSVVSGPQGMRVIALTRLTPIPFGLQNALFSLSSISIFRLLISSVGGLVPMTVLNCYMGSTLRNMQDLMSGDSNRLTGLFVFGGQILMTVVLLWFVVRRARVELKKTMDESDKLSPASANGDCTRPASGDAL